MSESKLRIKFGEHEFEAEGTGEIVDRQLAIFRHLVAPVPEPAASTAAAQAAPVSPPLLLERIMRVNGPIVSLTVKAPVSPADAVLLILLGQRQIRLNHIVSGTAIMSGLRLSGFRIRRADIILRKHGEQGLVIATGIRRTLRYQFSTTGIERARQIARQLIATLPEGVSAAGAGG